MKVKTRYNKKSKKTTLFTRKKSIAFFVFSLVCLLIIIMSFFVFDNLRVAVKTESLSVPALPAEMEKYTVLHISDLHGQYFGSEHSTLISAVEGRKYNIVLVTGDLIDSSCPPDDPQKQSVIDLFEYFAEAGKPVYYVLGNHDEPRIQYDNKGAAVENEFYLRLGETGAVLLDSPAQIPVGRNGKSIWLWPIDLVSISYDDAAAMLEDNLSGDDLTLSQTIQKKQYEALIHAVDNTDPRDVSLVMAHYPVTEARMADYEDRLPETALRLTGMNLVLAGHFHGGQLCLPFIGPVYVPNVDMGMNGFFPDRNLVSGMMTVSGVRQHISSGLGSTGVGSGRVKLLKFRLFCAPSVTFISLTSSLSAQ